MHIGIRAPAHAFQKSCKNKNEFSRSEIIILTLFVGAKWRNKLCVALTNEEGLAFNSLVWFVSPRKP